jgi:hypothetical protein
MSETPEVTPVNEWTVPNQDKLEQVIDARLNRNSESDSVENDTDTETNNDDAVEEKTEESDS